MAEFNDNLPRLLDIKTDFVFKLVFGDEKNKSVLKEELLPSAKEVKAFYERHGIPESKASFISSNYEKKVQMLKEFQKGKTISLYKEKKAFREVRYKKPEEDDM